MRRTLALLCLLALASLGFGCGSDNANSGNTGGANNNATRNGIVETNSNMSPRTNGNSVPSNTAVVTNNNGNDNTAGVKSTNGNNGNGNMKNGNMANGNMKNGNH